MTATLARAPLTSEAVAAAAAARVLILISCNHCATLCAGITMLLTLSVLQVIVNDTLPTTSDAVPFIGKSSYCSSKTYASQIYLVIN